MENWPFPDPPNVAVLTTRSITERNAWIAFVTHDADDGCWQFHDAEPGPPNEDDATIVSLRRMVEREPALRELADLPEGWRAWRDAPNGRWMRAPNR